MDGSAVGGYGFVVLVVEAFVVGSNVGVDDNDDEVRIYVDGDDEVRIWVNGDDNDGDEDGGFEV